MFLNKLNLYWTYIAMLMVLQYVDVDAEVDIHKHES